MGEEEEEEEEEGEKCVRAFMRQLCNFFFLCRFLTFVVPLGLHLQNLSRRLLFVRSVAIKTHGEMTGFLKRLLLPEVLLLRVQNVLLFLAHPKRDFRREFREKYGKITRFQTLVENIHGTKWIVLHAPPRYRDEKNAALFL